MYCKAIDSFWINVLWGIILHSNSYSCWHHPRCQGIMSEFKPWYCAEQWLKCWQMLSWWVRLLLFILSISNCDVPVTVRGHSKRCSIQDVDVSKKSISVQHDCEDKILLASVSYARGRFAIIYMWNACIFNTLWKSSPAVTLSSFVLFCYLLYYFVCHSWNSEVQKVEAKRGWVLWWRLFSLPVCWLVCCCFLVCFFPSLVVGHLVLVFKWWL